MAQDEARTCQQMALDVTQEQRGGRAQGGTVLLQGEEFLPVPSGTMLLNTGLIWEPYPDQDKIVGSVYHNLCCLCILTIE